MPYTHFTPKQRVELAVLLRAGHRQKDIAEMLGKDPSNISREITRNKDSDGKYRARTANQKTKERRIKANQRFRKIENNTELQSYIEANLKQYWSPEQIAGRLKRENNGTIVSYATIYNWIYSQRPELKRWLRCQKGKYRRRHGTKIREKQREETKKKRIDTRPEIVEKRERLGDWEGDIVFGRERKIGILTHTERKSGYEIADKMESLLAASVRETTVQRFKGLPRSKRHTVTYDNDTRFAEYEWTEEQMKTDIYFANPYHSWERGTNENTNGLLRQFFPKKCYFAMITQEDIETVLDLLNNRPRKRLNYLTPSEVFHQNCTLD